jgi:hypothetical protein
MPGADAEELMFLGLGHRFVVPDLVGGKMLYGILRRLPCIVPQGLVQGGIHRLPGVQGGEEPNY